MNDKVVSFDMNAAALVAAAAGPAGGAMAGAVVAAAPVVAGRGPRGAEAARRAEMVLALLRYLGRPLAGADLAEALSRAGTAAAAPGLEDLAGALRAVGLGPVVTDLAEAQPGPWPAIAEMRSGHLVLVLADEGASLRIHDAATRDKSRDIPAEEFRSYFTGRVLEIRADKAELARKHVLPEGSAHWFWGAFRPFRRQMGEVAAASLVANLLAVGVSLFSMQVYDRVIPYESVPTLWVLCLGALLAIGLEAMLKQARSSLMDLAGRRIEMGLQQRLMSRILGMKPDPARRSPSTVFTGMREFSSVREFFTATTIGTLADLPFLLIFLLLIASIGGNVVWIVLLGGVVMVLPGFLAQRRMMALAAESQGASTRSSRLLYETVFEAETITTQRGEDRIQRSWEELCALQSSAAIAQRHLAARLGYWAAAVQAATYVMAVVAGAFLVFKGDFTVGTIIAVGILTGRTLGPLAGLAGTLSKWTTVRSALEALETIMTAPQRQEAGRAYLRRDRLSGAMAVHHLRYGYEPGGAPTLDIEGLAIPAGQVVAVLGANGSGKSTFLRLLAGLLDPDSGRVMLDGVDMQQIHSRDLRRNIGYMGQDVRLVAGSLRDNLCLSGLEGDDERLFAALDFAGLGPFVRNHPRGLDMQIREMGEGLSVGQRQSIGWARLWLQDPAIALLDEPTAALDQVLEATLVSRLSAWVAGRTVIIATHRVPILHLAARTVILQNGRMAVDGPREAVLAHLAAAGGRG